VRVVIAEDMALLRQGLARLLPDAGFDVVGGAGDADELLELVARSEPDAALIDIKMPPTHTDEGLRAAAVIRERYPRPRSCCCPATWKPATPRPCSRIIRRGPDTCSKTASTTRPRSVTRCAG
jgi:DNA-binding NarL/FixJ family response regulator